MNLVRNPARDAAKAVGIASDPATLDDILQQGCSAAIWSRQLPQKVETWLDGLDPELLPRGRVVLQPGAVETVLGQLFDMSGFPAGPERDWLTKDIVFLAERFSQVMNVGYLRLRLDVVTTNACRKFHVDSVTARLVCTYRGTGTQYGFSRNGDDPEDVFTVPTGAPIQLRGTLWPVQPPSGLLHRSPPIEGTGETRLVLVLDPVFDPEEEV